MYDLHHVLNKVSANALLRGNSLMASDELALLRHLMKALDNPGVPIPLETTSIHNITDDDAKTGISLKQMSDLFRNVMGATPTGILVGQNLLSFDLLILRRFITKGADDGWRFLDTSVLRACESFDFADFRP
jgi:DNA polymerase III epsilon subunit-like protein